MKEFLERIVKELVDKPDEVSISPVESERTIIYELRVGDGDLGKVIGKHGRTAQAIRTIMSAISAKEGGKRALLEIVE
ncbi:MAG: KH domain-containing protein [Candidatus Marinimicrobia bacterium]|nr:KH domain-containing protein [Candidatus Neomarinimicrobiota bacterium]MCH8010589.1 KH domain-containing protein [Candidatus Neomarinimicrobiota bacterium]MCH8068846.1 KH domain-containing protein [Candidatus Neomarinimicrobiota bacterium]